MSINFPSSPANGAIFNNSTTGTSYTYYSQYGAWLLTANTAALISVSDSAPSSPGNGAMWYYSATGETYVWLSSANAWVSSTSTVPQATALNAVTTGKSIAMSIVFGG